jgi:hypothetical protein
LVVHTRRYPLFPSHLGPYVRGSVRRTCCQHGARPNLTFFGAAVKRLIVVPSRGRRQLLSQRSSLLPTVANVLLELVTVHWIHVEGPAHALGDRARGGQPRFPVGEAASGSHEAVTTLLAGVLSWRRTVQDQRLPRIGRSVSGEVLGRHRRVGGRPHLRMSLPLEVSSKSAAARHPDPLTSMWTPTGRPSRRRWRNIG